MKTGISAPGDSCVLKEHDHGAGSSYALDYKLSAKCLRFFIGFRWHVKCSSTFSMPAIRVRGTSSGLRVSYFPLNAWICRKRVERKFP
jgi:hypothetical protein